MKRSVLSASLLVLLLSAWACDGCARPPTELVLQVTDLSGRVADPEALSAAALALYASGSEKVAYDLLPKIGTDKPLLLLQIARYAALAGQASQSLDLTRQALALEPAADLDQVAIAVAKTAAAAKSSSLLAELQPVLRTKRLSASAAAQVVLASSEIAVATADWRLLDEAEPLIPLLTEKEPWDTALLALIWASTKRISATSDLGLLSRGERLAERISDVPKRAQAFALLAESCRQADSTDLMNSFVEKADSTMTGVRSHHEAADAFSRVALALRINREFSRQAMTKALQYAQREDENTLGLPFREAATWKSMVGILQVTHLAKVAVAAAKLNEPAVADHALAEALDKIVEIDRENPMLFAAVHSFLQAFTLVDSTDAQKSALTAVQQYAISLKEPYIRVLILAAVSDAAQEIAIGSGSKDFLEIAWQALASSPMSELREGQLVRLAYSGGRLGEPDFVTRRLPSLGRASTPSLDLKLLSAALAGFEETRRHLAEPPSLFALETEIDADKLKPTGGQFW